MRDVTDGLDLAPPYEGAPSGERVITPQYTGEDYRKGEAEHQAYRRWRDLPLAERQRMSVVTCVVQMWNQFGKLPTIERISNYKKMVPARVAEALENPQTILDLRHHGIIRDDCDDWTQAVSGERAGLTSRQVAAVREYLARTDPTDGRSLTQALADAEVTPTEWNSWLKDPIFKGYVLDLGSQVYGDARTDIDIALVREAASGDVPAIRLAMEVTGRIKNDKNAPDPGMLLARIFEIMARHCTPEQQTAIGAEMTALAAILRGNTAAAAPRVLEGTVLG